MDSNIIPKISVILPVYNGEKYIKQSVDSILSQTFTNFELIIIDDGSKDKSVEIIESYTDTRIRLIKNSTNRGTIESLNIGIKESRADFIARMDQDDISFPQRLQVEYDFLINNRHIAIVGSWSYIINKDGDKLRIYKNPETWDVIKYELMFGNKLVHPSIMMRKSIIMKMGMYEKGCITEDYNLYSRLVHIYGLANIPTPLIYYRQHEESVTGVSTSQKIIHNDTNKMILKNISYYLKLTERQHYLISEVLIARNPNPSLSMKDVYFAYRTHKVIYEIFTKKESLNDDDLKSIKRLYTSRRNLMLVKYLVGKYHWIKECLKLQ